MTLLFWLFIIVSLGLVYWFIVRPVLKRITILAPVFADLDAAEAGWGAKVSATFKGLKTLIFARMVWLSGIIVTVYDSAAGQLAASGTDWHTLIPAQWVWVTPILAVIVGGIFEFLRHVTTGPVATTTAPTAPPKVS